MLLYENVGRLAHFLCFVLIPFRKKNYARCLVSVLCAFGLRQTGFLLFKWNRRVRYLYSTFHLLSEKKKKKQHDRKIYIRRKRIAFTKCIRIGVVCLGQIEFTCCATMAGMHIRNIRICCNDAHMRTQYCPRWNTISTGIMVTDAQQHSVPPGQIGPKNPFRFFFEHTYNIYLLDY